MGENSLLGDTAYIGQAFPFVITPRQDNGTLTEADHQHNAAISRGRVIAEQAFGRMKCKWRRLRVLQNTWIDCGHDHNGGLFPAYRVGTSAASPEHPKGCPREDDGNV